MATIKILVIEDNSDIRYLLSEMLKQLDNYEVYLAPSGEKGLEVVREHSIDLVLMDIGLQGGIDGIETAQSISKTVDIPVIYLTGAADQDTINKAKLTSPYGYLIKPININQIQAAIEIALYKYQYEKQIQKQRRLLSTTLSSITDGVITTDQNGFITYFNKSAGNITGLSNTEVLGKNIYSLLASLQKQRDENETASEVPNLINHIHDNSLPAESFSIITKNQKEISIEISSSPIIDEQNNTTGEVFIFRDITERKESEKKLQAYQEKLRSLNSSLSVIEDTQRRHFAIQLHETIGQKLAMGKLKLANIPNIKRNSEIKSILQDLSSIIDDAINDIRLISKEISPPALYEIGLEAGIHWLIERVRGKYDLDIRFNKNEAPLSLNMDTRIILFHSVRELVLNAVNHSEATNLSISISNKDSQVFIEVQDNGKGFNVDALMSEMETNERFGLFTVREKVEYLGGSFTVESKIGEGTTGTITLPL